MIPWALVFPGAKPLFYSPEISRHLDFVSVHFYPRKGKVPQAVTALKKYDIGKPLLIEEFFPLRCSQSEAETFIKESAEFADGCVSFYWGTTIKEYQQQEDLKSAIIAQWLIWFKSQQPAVIYAK